MKKEQVVNLLKAKPYYLATVDEMGEPQVRPFQSGVLIDNKICICTNSEKPVYSQLINNESVQISTTAEGYDWFRINAKAKLVSPIIKQGEPLDIYRAAMFDDMPNLKPLYEGNEHNMQVFELTDLQIIQAGTLQNLE